MKKQRTVTEKRDTSADKRKIKKIGIVILASFLALALLLGLLSVVAELLYPDADSVSYDDLRFFEVDYSKNIFENQAYLSLNRSINYDRYGVQTVLDQNNVDAMHVTAEFFYDYFSNIINGDYSNHTSFYTDEYLDIDDEKKVFPIPEKFTMQGIYDINIKLYGVSETDKDKNESTEIFEVSYRIFENNGTFRRDIVPDETQTLVYELYISNGVVKINSIAYRTNG